MEDMTVKSGIWNWKSATLATLATLATIAHSSEAVNDWENTAVNSRNRLPARAYTVPLADESAALTDELEFSSPYVMSLNGEWRFRWTGDPARRPQGFEKPGYDDSGWGVIDVPSCVEMRGYGSPIYTNTRYPHKKSPPRILDNASGRADFNPVSSYRRTFTLPESWRGRDTILRFEGVGSAFYVWINGELAGYAEDSKLPSEFDVTPFVREEGENTIAVEVYKWCDGSYLEDQDMFRFSGIFRDVSLWSRPKGGIWDFVVKTRPLEGYESWSLELELENGVSATLYDANKKRVGDLIPTPPPTSNSNSPSPSNSLLQLQLTPNLWSAEKPYLYTLVVKKGGDIRARRIGFKEQRVDGSRILVNGRAIKFKGVNRHETSPENGRTVTVADMVRDIELMKRYNVNTVRTCHYPDHRLWYDLCDRYGIYLVAEANVEGHGAGYGDEGLGLHEEWRDSIVERNVRQVLFYRNSPSVTIWSMGNETKHGDCFRAAIAAVKALDPSRPVHWERGNVDADVDSTMYPSVEWIEKRGCLGDGLIPDERMPRKGMSMKGREPSETDQTRLKPFFVCEYAHAMGNAMGNFAEYWDAFYRYGSLSGGCVWDWADQGIWKCTGRLDPKTGRRERFLAYGGDFDDSPNDGPFCMNGVVDSERHVTPKLVEMAHVHRNLVVESGTGESRAEAHGRGGEDGAGFVLWNRFGFTNADEFDGFWELLADGEAVASGEFAVPAVEPSARAAFSVPALEEAFKGCSADAECFVNFSFATKAASGLVPKGWVVARDQIRLREGAEKVSSGAADATLTVEKEDSASLSVSCGGTVARFDKRSGVMTYLRFADGTEPLDATVEGVDGGPKLTCARAFTDNDKWMEDKFFASGLSQLKHHAMSVAVEGNAVKIVVDVSGSKGCGFRHECAYAFCADGSVEMENKVVPYGVMPELPRLGLSMRLALPFENVGWYGRGPDENYIDRRSGSFVGRYAAKVRDLFVDYARPQDNGFRTDVRWVSFTDADGGGVRFGQSEPSAFQAMEYDWEDLCFSRHRNGERRRRAPLAGQGAILVNLDIRQTGLGGASCGPGPMDEYRFDPSKTVEWTVWIVPERKSRSGKFPQD